MYKIFYGLNQLNSLSLKNFGIKDAECVDGIGANAKMNEFCAAMGICNLRHIEDNIASSANISDAEITELIRKK